MSDFPRRGQMQKWIKAERMIYDAIQEVELMGADVRLTDAVILLGKAKDRVADFIDGVNAPETGQDGEVSFPLPLPEPEDMPSPHTAPEPEFEPAPDPPVVFSARQPSASAQRLRDWADTLEGVYRMRVKIPVPPSVTEAVADLRAGANAIDFPSVPDAQDAPSVESFRKWSVANVRAAQENRPKKKCGHQPPEFALKEAPDGTRTIEWTSPCVECAYEMGISQGHAEAGAVIPWSEVKARLLKRADAQDARALLKEALGAVTAISAIAAVAGGTDLEADADYWEKVEQRIRLFLQRGQP